MKINEMFPDEAFAKEIERLFDFSKNPELAIKEIKELRRLDLSELKIKNIEGIQIFENLKYLYLYKNQISDISYLENLIHLVRLDLSDNQIVDFSHLAHLANLRSLNLTNNKCANVYLPNLSQLKILILGKECDLTTLPLLENLGHLIVGEKESNEKYYSVLPKLSNVEKLNAFLTYDNKLKDYTFIDNLPNLNHLTIYVQKRRSK